jgi:hypothetical protein
MVETSAMSAEPGRPLRLHPLTYLEDHGEVVVGRTDIDSYGSFPPDGAELLRQLAAGYAPEDAAQWYADTYGEQVDMAGFLDLLDEFRFLVRDDDTAAPLVRWRRLGGWVFSPVAWACYSLVIVVALAAMVRHPRLAPQSANLFFTHYLSVLELVIFLGQLPLVLVHESFHALAGRRLGLRSSLGVSHRLYFVVFETTIDGLVAVPRRKRFMPLLAGMLADVLIIAILTLIAAVTMRPDGSVPLVGGLSLALAFATLLRFIWQFFFYLRTDLYYVVVTVLGCTDLQAAARCILANKFRRIVGRPMADESRLHPRDRAAGRWYAWLMAAGYTFSVCTLALSVPPAFWRILSVAVGRLHHAGQSWRDIADSMGFLALNLAQVLVVIALAVRSSRRRSRAAN